MPAPQHDASFRVRRFLNWFPLGLSYALLYMGRYNLTVAKNSLGELLTKEDFGIVFAAGTIVYAFAFLVNGPLVDRLGGRRGMLMGLFGAACANLAIGLYLRSVVGARDADPGELRLTLCALYAVNMYFQSFGAVSVVKVNAHWFHVTERGGFSGIFGTMISSGTFLAFTVNDWLIERAHAALGGKVAASTWVAFVVPAAALALAFAVLFFVLRDRPSQAGLADFETGDASSGESLDEPVPTLTLYRRILSHPVILTIALIELCTGVLRNGVMQWFPIYAKEYWALPSAHFLRNGSWQHTGLIAACFGVAIVGAALAAFASGGRRAMFAVTATLAFVIPFLQGGWGGLLMVSGIVGGNLAGWVSDAVFQSRRGPAAAAGYALLLACTLGMLGSLSPPTNVVEHAKPDSGLVDGDRIVEIAGRSVHSWEDVRRAVACWEPGCERSGWDSARCACDSSRVGSRAQPSEHGAIPAKLERAGQTLELTLRDPMPVQRAGDLRLLAAEPRLPYGPWRLGALVFLISVAVFGVHGVLSGPATMDFGGRRGAATAVGVIDGFVYLGTAIQSVSLGYITGHGWSGWPLFLVPFAAIGLLLTTRIWNAKPGAGAH